MPIELFRFFQHARPEEGSEEEEEGHQRELRLEGCAVGAVVGPPSSGKRALLFHYAYSLALDGHLVWFLSVDLSPRPLSSPSPPPSFPPSRPLFVPDPNALRRILFRTVSGEEELRVWLAGMHMVGGERPRAVVVSCVQRVSISPRPSSSPSPLDSLFRSVALLFDSFSSMRSSSPGLDTLLFGVTIGKGSEEMAEGVMKGMRRWVDVVMKVMPTDLPDTLCLSLDSLLSLPDPFSLEAAFSLVTGYFALQGLTWVSPGFDPSLPPPLPSLSL